jgi:DNA-binding transcriptional regulator YdaS (Cro superfamily)
LQNKSRAWNTLDWITAGLDVVSAKRAVEIERLTAGKITRVMLHPDLFESCVPYE